jgi:hypothetical protein
MTFSRCSTHDILIDQRHMTEHEYIEAADGVVLRLAADGSA